MAEKGILGQAVRETHPEVLMVVKQLTDRTDP
jgi:hypothetical protein